LGRANIEDWRPLLRCESARILNVNKLSLTNIQIAAFGLSGLWLSQFAEKVLYERLADGKKGDIDVFKFFVFLAIILMAVGMLGAVLLKVVDEEELIDEGVEAMESSGLIDHSESFVRANGDIHAYREQNYGTLRSGTDADAAEADPDSDEAKAHAEEEARKKTWLLNEETRIFLGDHTMWWLTAGFFFVSGMFPPSDEGIS
jgi:hypothetical protein